jgi:Flp pilus assembly protein TadD
VQAYLAVVTAQAQPSTIEELGADLIRSGDTYEAIRELRREEQRNPSPTVRIQLGLAYYVAGQHRLFALKMNQATEADPLNFAPFYYLGRHFENDLQEYTRAAAYFSEALKRKPDHYPSQYYLGFCLESMGKEEEAERAFQRAVELSELAGARFSLPHGGLARLYLRRQDSKTALLQARKAVELAPEDALARTLLAKILTQLGQDADAARELEAAVGLADTDPAILYQLHTAYKRSGKHTAAADALRRYRELAALY